MLVIGEVGSAKSSLVKCYLHRQALFGRIPWISDPKGEYGPLAEALGVEPITLRPGGDLRINPIGAREDWQGQLSLLQAIVASALGRPLEPEERGALREAIRELNGQSPTPTLPRAVDLLLRPTSAMAERIATTPARLAMAARGAALGAPAPLRGRAAPACSTARRPKASTSTAAPSCSTSRPSTTPRRSPS